MAEETSLGVITGDKGPIFEETVTDKGNQRQCRLGLVSSPPSETNRGKFFAGIYTESEKEF